jgi:hypothetical protein
MCEKQEENQLEPSDLKVNREQHEVLLEGAESRQQLSSQ